MKKRFLVSICFAERTFAGNQSSVSCCWAYTIAIKADGTFL
jgi:hypothetical protein